METRILQKLMVKTRVSATSMPAIFLTTQVKNTYNSLWSGPTKLAMEQILELKSLNLFLMHTGWYCYISNQGSIHNPLNEAASEIHRWGTYSLLVRSITNTNICA